MSKAKKSASGFFEAGQMAIFWRILHLLIQQYGNHPMGQALVVLTMVYLNDRGMPPTLTQLCAATGLPKASVSRYVASQIEKGLVEESVDPKDRRRRLLVQTAEGRAEWQWQAKAMDKIFREVEQQLREFHGDGDPRRAEELLQRMTRRTQNSEKGRP